DSQQHHKELFQRYLNNRCTKEEVDQLIIFFQAADETKLRGFISAALLDDSTLENDTSDYQPKLSLIYQQLSAQIIAEGSTQANPRKYLWLRIAAIILVFVSVGSYFFLYKSEPTTQLVQQQIDHIVPGRNQATLTLANGKKITLTKGLSGTLAQEGNTLIQVNGKNAIAYTSNNVNSNAPVEYNTLSTAKGEESPYPLVLADGTKIWLNALSSITFPTAFKGKERIVKVTGEVYFEVVHNDALPFKVLTKGQIIEDIGTHFNVNAYDDEPAIKTTLLEGSVKVSLANASSIKEKAGVKLIPGQQAIINTASNNLSVKNVDLDDAVAWRNGMFFFNDTDIKTIMRQLARWYNVEVSFKGNISTERLFSGEISKDARLSEVLKALKMNKINFKIEGEKVTVYP
ncbi:MAG TPA: FecR domain-containing protein, partial [Pedobacter sp.]|nr:FecR domain-containing protein [Pedobacter sp.]